MLISIFAVKMLLKPIKALVTAANSMANGHYSTRVNIHSEDEIGMLASRFNSMAESIEANINEIKAQQADLEEKNHAITQINSIIQEFAHQTKADEVLRLIGVRCCELSHASDYGVFRPLPNGSYEAPFISESFPAETCDVFLAGIFENPTDCVVINITTEDHCNAAVDKKKTDEKESPCMLVLYRKDKPLEHAAIDLVSACVHSGAIAIENIRKIALQAEMETARAVQSALFPSAELQIPYLTTHSHYFSPGQVGGDWYGYVEREKDALLFIADATGHGASAALITAVARSAVSSVQSIRGILEIMKVEKEVDITNFQPHDYMSHLNKMVEESGRGRVLMTGICVRVNPIHREIHICNAGHTHPFLYESGLAKVRALPLHGYRLGYEHNAEFETKAYRYEPGSLLVLYSDGITEAHNSKREEFGVKRLKETIQAHAAQGPEKLKEEILNAVAAFASGIPYEDDITLVIAELC